MMWMASAVIHSERQEKIGDVKRRKLLRGKVGTWSRLRRSLLFDVDPAAKPDLAGDYMEEHTGSTSPYISTYIPNILNIPEERSWILEF